MYCSSCGHENVAGSKFCAECGQSLLACPSCAAVPPPGARFCNQCGTPLAALPEPTGPTTEAAPPPAAAVRKYVTALMADLVGSTAFGERLDPEAVREAIAPYHDLVRTTVEDHGGTLVKFMGDGALAIFGLPEIAEDDAVRAVAAGLDLQRRFPRFATQLRDRHGVELGLRVGINSGELVVSDGDADLLGDVLNTAARLESACEPGTVLVGEDTWRLTRTTTTYSVLGEVRAKGKTEPMAVFRAIDDVAHAADDTPFVGRGAELAILEESLADAAATSTARLVTVIGQPGVGKTRLAAELRNRAAATTFDLRFERHGSTTFTPIADLLRSVTDGSLEGVRQFAATHHEEARLTAVLLSFLGHGEARSTEESFWAVRRLLELLAADQPVVLVVDDIQWAEPRFWDLLDHLVEWTAAPVLIVALARPELRDLRPELTQPGRRVAAAISLEGLDQGATRELAARLLDADDLPDQLVERIPVSTEGNPLFIRELIQMLVDDGTLERRGDRWRLTIDADAIEVPPTILSLLAARVERLADDEREVVELASVVGTDFDRGALGVIAPESLTAGLGAVLERLRRKDLIEPTGAWAGDHPIFRFHHVLIRDAAYRRILKGRRADLHAEIGRYLDRALSPGHDSDIVAAHHYELAVRYRTELAITDDETTTLASTAVARLRTAADEALRREDLAAAGVYALRALALLEPIDPNRDDLLLLGCEAFLGLGDVAKAAPMVEELHDRSTDGRTMAWADCFRAQRWSLTDADRLIDAAELSASAASRLGPLGDTAGVAKAHLVRASCLARMGRIGDCETELELALTAARAAQDRRRTAAVLGAAPLAALWGPSPVARAGGRCLDVLRLLRITNASPAAETTSIRCQAVLEALRDRMDQAREKLEASRSTARELGLRQGLYETELFAGFVEMWAGDHDRAVAHLRLAHEGLDQLGLGADAGQAAALLAQSLLLEGRVTEAESLAEEAVAGAGQNLRTALLSRSSLAEVRAHQNRPDEARALLDEAVSIAEQADVVLDHALVLLAGARVFDRLDDRRSCHAWREHAAVLLTAKGVERLEGPEAAEPGAATDHESAPTADQPGQPDAHDSPEGRGFPFELVNRTTRAWDLRDEHIRRGDAESVIAMMAPGFSYVARDRHGPYIEGGSDTAGSIVNELIAADVPIRSQVVAIRDDDLCLVRFAFGRSETGEEGAILVVVETDDEGRFTHWGVRAADQLFEAGDELDDRWVGGALLDRSRGIRAAYANFDPSALRLILADDFVLIDHRPLGLGTLDADQYAELVGRTAAAADVQLVIAGVHGPVGTVGLRRLDIYRDGEIATSTLTIVAFRGELLASLELFDLDHFPDALDRLRELVGDVAPASLLVNRATAAWQKHTGHMNQKDVAAVLAMFSPDFVMSSRHRTRPSLDTDANGAAAMLRETIAVGFDVESEVLAIRGDDLCLTRGRLETEAGDRTDFLTVTQIDDAGRITYWGNYDADQLIDAQFDLNTRTGWLPAGHAQLLRNATSAYREADTGQLRALLADDFVHVDHRSLGFGEADANQFSQTVIPLATQGGAELVFSRLDITAEGNVVAQADFVTSDAEWSVLGLYVMRGTTFARIEVFDVDDVERARARIDEIDQQHPKSPSPLANRAARAWLEHIERSQRGDIDGVIAMMRPDFRFRARQTSRLHLDGDREVIRDVIAETHSVGFRPRSEILAIRGENHCLAAVELQIDGYQTEFVTAVETDDDGRFVYWGSYDREEAYEAQYDLDTRWGGYPDGLAAILRDFCAAYRHVAPSELRTLLTDDFLNVDHRPLGFGELSADQIAEMLQPLAEQDGIELITRTVHEVARRAALMESDFRGREVRWRVVGITTWREGQLNGLEVFGPDDLETARRRFDLLVANDGNKPPTGGQ